MDIKKPLYSRVAPNFANRCRTFIFRRHPSNICYTRHPWWNKNAPCISQRPFGSTLSLFADGKQRFILLIQALEQQVWNIRNRPPTDQYNGNAAGAWRRITRSLRRYIAQHGYLFLLLWIYANLGRLELHKIDKGRDQGHDHVRVSQIKP